MFIYDYKNGKHGYNTSPERGADTFHPFNSKNYKNATVSVSAGNNTINVGFEPLMVFFRNPANTNAYGFYLWNGANVNSNSVLKITSFTKNGFIFNRSTGSGTIEYWAV